MTEPSNSTSIIFSIFRAFNGHSFTHFMHPRQKDAADVEVLTRSGLSSASVITATNLWFIPYLSVYTFPLYVSCPSPAATASRALHTDDSRYPLGLPMASPRFIRSWV